jgi:hypothetical protein
MLQWAIHICFKCMFNVSSVSDVCCKCFIWMFFLRVSFGYCKTRSGCYKTRSGCCIYMQMFQVFSYVCCKCFILMFAMATHVFSSFSGVLQVFQTYVASVSAGCCKGRSSVAHVAVHVRSGWARAVPTRGLTARASSG